MRIALLVSTLAITVGTASFEVSRALAQDAPAVPTLEQVLSIPPQYLAAGYLAVDATAAMVEAAAGAGFTINTTLDGKKQTITKSNLDAYLTAYRARLEIYRRAIKQRGFAEIQGRYALDAGASCRGQQLDLREMFAGAVRTGEPVMANELNVRQAGFKADLVLSTNYEGQTREIVFPGAVVGNAVVFAAPANMGFNFWGAVHERVVELRLDVREFQSAVGVSDSDLPTVENCVFTLTPK